MSKKLLDKLFGRGGKDVVYRWFGIFIMLLSIIGGYDVLTLFNKFSKTTEHTIYWSVCAFLLIFLIFQNIVQMFRIQALARDKTSADQFKILLEEALDDVLKRSKSKPAPRDKQSGDVPIVTGRSLSATPDKDGFNQVTPQVMSDTDYLEELKKKSLSRSEIDKMLADPEIKKSSKIINYLQSQKETKSSPKFEWEVAPIK